MSNITQIVNDVVLIPHIHRVLLTIAYSIIAAFGVPGNLMILVIILHNKKLRQLTLNQYIVTLAFTDLLTCGLSAPFFIFSLNVIPNSDVLQSGMLCKGFLTVTYSTGMLTVSALAVLSLDRCLAITKPYLYSKYTTSEKVCILNICLLLQVILTMLPATVIKGYIENDNVQGLVCVFRTNNMNSVYSSYIIAVNVVLPLLAITLCNIIVFLVAKNQYKKISAALTRDQQSSSFSGIMKYSATGGPVWTRSFTGVQNNRVRKVHPIHIQVDSQNESRNIRERVSTGVSSFEVAPSVQEEYDIINAKKIKTGGNILRRSFKRVKSKRKEKDLKSSLSPFKFQYRIYISTLSMIILLFIFWSPFPVIRVMAMLGYNEQIMNYAYLYSTLGTTILSLINPFVIFITRNFKGISKAHMFQAKKNNIDIA